MSRVKTIADLVVARLNSQSYGEAFTATTKLFPRFDDSATGTLDVCVVSGPHERAKLDRGTSTEILQSVPVVVRAKVSGNYSAIETRAETLLSIVEAIEDDLLVGDGAKLGDWRAQEITQSVPFNFDKLLENSIFQSILTLKYKGLT
jgi:hypothetical protein